MMTCELYDKSFYGWEFDVFLNAVREHENETGTIELDHRMIKFTRKLAI
jgi:hypothetical protein